MFGCRSLGVASVLVLVWMIGACSQRDEGAEPQPDAGPVGVAAVAVVAEPESPTRPPADVLILVLDSCRPDKMGAYGFARPTTPRTDAIAADPDAVLFRRHYSQAPATKASTASLFTGLLVRQHGVLESLGFEEGKQIFRTERLDGRFGTLAEHFRAAGYFTFGVVKSWHLIPEYGYAKGFDVYDSPRNRPGSDRGRTKRTQELIVSAKAPYFGYVHLNACHHPFRPDLRDADYLEQFGFEYDEAARQATGVDFTIAATKSRILAGELELDEDDERFLNLLYEAKMRGADENFVGPLVATLRETGRWDNTLLIVTADHGEELYEHGGYAHGYALWDEIIHIPLIVKFPAGARPAALGSEVTALTRTVDVTVSLIEWLGRTPHPSLAGVSLFDAEFAHYALSERADQGHALLRGDHKFIDDRGRQLFELRGDPGEQEDLAAQAPDQVADMRSFARDALTALAETAARAPVIQKPVDPAEIEALRSLGYLD